MYIFSLIEQPNLFSLILNKCPVDQAKRVLYLFLLLYIVWQLHVSAQYSLCVLTRCKTTINQSIIFTAEKLIVNKHCSDIETKFAVGITESQEKLPTSYWLPKLHKRPYKVRFIANSSSCTTTSLSKVLTSCLTAIKNHWIKYCEKTYESEGINYFWSITNSTEILNKLKTKGSKASTISTYDFSTLYTKLPHNLIRNQLVDLIENIRHEEVLYLACNEGHAFSLPKNIKI